MNVYSVMFVTVLGFCVPAQACYLWWWRRRRALRIVQSRRQQQLPTCQVGKHLNSRYKCECNCLCATLPPTQQLVRPGTEQLGSSRMATSNGSSPQSASSFTLASQSGNGLGSVTSEPSQSDDGGGGRKNSLLHHGKNKRQLVRPALVARQSSADCWTQK